MLVAIQHIQRNDNVICKSKKFIYGLVLDHQNDRYYPFHGKFNGTTMFDCFSDDFDTPIYIGIDTQLDGSPRYAVVDRIIVSKNVDESIYVEEMCYQLPTTNEYVVFALRVSGWKLGNFFRRVYSILPNCERIKATLERGFIKDDVFVNIKDCVCGDDEFLTKDDIFFNKNLSPMAYNIALLSDVLSSSTCMIRPHVAKILEAHFPKFDNPSHNSYIKNVIERNYTINYIGTQTKIIKTPQTHIYKLPNIKTDTVVVNSPHCIILLDMWQDLMASYIDTELIIGETNKIYVNYYENKYSKVSANYINKCENIKFLKDFLESTIHNICRVENIEEETITQIRFIKNNTDEMYIYLYDVHNKTTLYYYDIISLTLHCSGILDQD